MVSWTPSCRRQSAASMHSVGRSAPSVPANPARSSGTVASTAPPRRPAGRPSRFGVHPAPLGVHDDAVAGQRRPHPPVRPAPVGADVERGERTRQRRRDDQVAASGGDRHAVGERDSLGDPPHGAVRRDQGRVPRPGRDGSRSRRLRELLPRPSTTSSLRPASRARRSAWSTRDPSGSWRSRRPWGPATTSRRRPAATRSTTAGWSAPWPAPRRRRRGRPARTCCVPQLASHSRPSRHRPDAPRIDTHAQPPSEGPPPPASWLRRRGRWGASSGQPDNRRDAGALQRPRIHRQDAPALGSRDPRRPRARAPPSPVCTPLAGRQSRRQETVTDRHKRPAQDWYAT
jgi:hypothetical protein